MPVFSYINNTHTVVVYLSSHRHRRKIPPDFRFARCCRVIFAKSIAMRCASSLAAGLGWVALRAAWTSESRESIERISLRASAMSLSAMAIRFATALSAFDVTALVAVPTPLLHSFSSNMRLTLFTSRRSAHDDACARKTNRQIEHPRVKDVQKEGEFASSLKQDGESAERGTHQIV